MENIRKSYDALYAVVISDQSQKWLPILFFGIFILLLGVICLWAWLATRRKNSDKTECLGETEEHHARTERDSGSDAEQKHASDAFLWSGIRR
jgi:hypothetical protein